MVRWGKERRKKRERVPGRFLGNGFLCLTYESIDLYCIFIKEGCCFRQYPVLRSFCSNNI